PNIIILSNPVPTSRFDIVIGYLSFPNRMVIFGMIYLVSIVFDPFAALPYWLLYGWYLIFDLSILLNDSNDIIFGSDPPSIKHITSSFAISTISSPVHFFCNS